MQLILVMWILIKYTPHALHPFAMQYVGEKKERSKINNLHFYLRKLEKEEQIKPKEGRRFKILAQKSMKMKLENQ